MPSKEEIEAYCNDLDDEELAGFQLIEEVSGRHSFDI